VVPYVTTPPIVTNKVTVRNVTDGSREGTVCALLRADPRAWITLSVTGR